jgi:hypothetical protein
MINGTFGCDQTEIFYRRDNDFESLPLMKLAALLLLCAGWLIVLAAVALLRPVVQQIVFVIAGIAVEALGCFLLFRAHLPSKEAS